MKKETSNSIKKISKKIDEFIPLDPIKDKIIIFQDFINFIKKFGVLGLSLGVVIGGAVKTLVDSFVLDIINPILGKILGKVDLNSLVFYDIYIGKFLTQLINFLVLVIIVYFVIKIFLIRFLSEEEKKSLKIE